MKQVVICLGVAVMIVSIVFAQTQNQTTLLSASEAWKDVRRAIDKGNAQWSEGWAKGDPDGGRHLRRRRRPTSG